MNPQDQLDTKKLVLACMKVMYDEKTFKFLKQGLLADGPVADKLANEVVGLLKLVAERAPNGVPRQLLLPAAAFLVSQVANFIEKAGIADVKDEDIATAMSKLPKLLAAAMPAGQPAQPQPAAQQPMLAQGGA
jgi:hypothetical protein